MDVMNEHEDKTLIRKGIDKMIYTVTLNPALDYVIHLKAGLELGETNRSTGEEHYFGGKGINVSVILNRLGTPSRVLGFVAGYTGEAIVQGIMAEGLDDDMIRLKNGASRINVKIKSEDETEINANGPEIAPDELEQLMSRLDEIGEGDVLVLAGSIPKSVPADIYLKMLQRVEGKGVLTVVDASGEVLKQALPLKPFLIKPNLAELSGIFGCEPKGDAEVLQYAKKLQELGAKNVLVSLGSEGALLLSEEGTAWKIGVPVRDRVNTVGSGDSMVAGFLSGYLKSHDMKEALILGSAAASATAMSPGLADQAKILDMEKRILRGDAGIAEI